MARNIDILLDGDGLQVVTSRGIERLALDTITAYKVDALTSDLICCDIVAELAGDRQIITVHEDLPGFDRFMSTLETLPGVHKGWREAVILPTFAHERTLLYSRIGVISVWCGQ